MVRVNCVDDEEEEEETDDEDDGPGPFFAGWALGLRWFGFGESWIWKKLLLRIDGMDG